jgi:hypothetical protein
MNTTPAPVRPLRDPRISTEPKKIRTPQLWVCRLKDTTWPKLKRPLPK